MKRLFPLIILNIAVWVCGNMLVNKGVTPKQQTYAMTAIVEKCCDDIVTVSDYNGNMWEYYGVAKPGQQVTLVMNDNATPLKLTDDVIIEVK